MIRSLTTLFVLAISLFITSSTAQAQIQRTFVSTTGTDAGNCNPNAPCRTFSYALTQTASGGEIIALTSGGYGPVEITKSVQITAPTGVYVAITTTPANAIGGTDAIRVSAGSGDVVVIRGLTLNNLGTTDANGITFPSGTSLYVENCVINGFDNHGIQVDRSTTGSSSLSVTGTIIRNSGGSGLDAGIFLRQTAAGPIRATIDNCRLERGGYAGVYMTDNTRTTIRNTVAARNLGYGFIVAATTGTTAELNLENSSATLNGSGINVGDRSPFTGGTATARISFTTSGNNTNSGITIAANGTAHISNSNINGNFTFDGVAVNSGGTARISDSNINNNGQDGVDVSVGSTVNISTSTINGNVSDGIELSNDSTSVVSVSHTTISGNGAKGLNRSGALSVATSTGTNTILNNTGGSDAFSSTVSLQ